MTKVRFSMLLLAGFGVGAAHAAPLLSEQDYLGEQPVVLTVTRLAQPQSETPGAVTLIDRETIRRSGARELADVLRLVPGYLVSGWNGANPGASYHAFLDDFGARNLVLIDGRSVYSSYYLGDTHRGMMGVLLEDIERIEVLRGSNSAAYGANAMFGVINVITRHAGDTHGGAVSASGGGAGIHDNMARLGWGNDQASFRLSTGRRSDTGYGNAHDDKIVSQLHLRGDLRPSADHELMLTAGVIQQAAGEGFPAGAGNPARTVLWRDLYLHGQWRHDLSEAQQVQFSATWDEETFRDRTPHGALPGVMLDFGGIGRRLDLEFQHTLTPGETLRAVWGVGAKREEAISAPLYHVDSVSLHRERLFGNLEWRVHPRWLINAGAFMERDSWTGTRAAPRLMANFHVLPGQTLRAGVTESWRAPSLLELAGDVRYFRNGILVGRTIAATGKVQPELLVSRELGYLGEFRDWGLHLDVRVFDERMSDFINRQHYRVATVLPVTGSRLDDYANIGALRLRGREYQMRWKPLAGTELMLNQLVEKALSTDGGMLQKAPTHTTTLAWFQKLPGDLDFAAMYHAVGAMTWRNALPATRRLDLRLAYPFRLGGTRAEAAITVQAANGNLAEFEPAAGYFFPRRAFGTLRLEF